MQLKLPNSLAIKLFNIKEGITAIGLAYKSTSNLPNELSAFNCKSKTIL